MSSSSSKIHTSLLASHPQTPRFLFRYWNNTSAGDPSLNTTHKIIPQGFKGLDSFPNAEPLYDEDFAQTAINHLQAKKFGADDRSCFTSWSHSLAYVLTMAFAKGKMKPEVNGTAYVAVLDTSLLEGNVVMHTTTLNRMLSKEIPMNPWEYLIYGVVRGDAYQAVPWMRLEEHVRKCYADANENMRKAKDSTQSNNILKHVAEVAGKAGIEFKPPFRRVVVANFLAIVDWNEKGLCEVAKRMGCSDILKSWAEDPKLAKADTLECHGVPEALRANELLRQLVVLTSDEGGILDPSLRFIERHRNSKESTVEEIGRMVLRYKEGSFRRRALKEYNHMMCLQRVQGEQDDSKQHQYMGDRLDDIVDYDDDDEVPQRRGTAVPRPRLRVTNPDVSKKGGALKKGG